MGLAMFFVGLLAFLAGGSVAGAACFYFFKKKASKLENRIINLRHKKLDKCLEALIEYNRSVGNFKGAVSNYISFGGEENLEDLKKADRGILDAFKNFYRVEAYLLSMNAVDAHKIMCEYIEIISQLRLDFHYTNEGLRFAALQESVVGVKDCRRRLYSSLYKFYSGAENLVSS